MRYLLPNLLMALAILSLGPANTPERVAADLKTILPG
jgi:hypothetical protein